MIAKELRKKFIDFFVSNGHVQIKSAPLVPENDPTVLFTTAGMHPLVPFLLGEKHPAGKRLVNIQKCLRTGDIDDVGDNIHNTFFEMMGNWSFDDYWKKEAIKYSWEFLTKILKLDKNKIAISCFVGDKDCPRDNESAEIWLSLGISKEKIAYLGKLDNWWGPAGKTGPCGPDTEMFYWTGINKAPKKFDPNDNKWMEIWNNVFMQYERKLKVKSEKLKVVEYEYIQLKQKNVDTGMGLERTLAVINEKKSVYETEIFLPIINLIKKISYTYHEREARIITDHIRSSVFIIADGIKPSNLDQGYILRRLIRRIIRYANLIGIQDKNYLEQLSDRVIDKYKGIYPGVDKKKEIFEVLRKEKDKFEKALVVGEKEFGKLVQSVRQNNQDKISGREMFKLFESYGLPFEIIEKMAKKEHLKVDKKEFDKAFEKHQLLSRKGAEKKFKGGLADNSEQVTKLHTAAHLLHASLRKILGEHVKQCGSNITADRLRFDFYHPEKLTNNQKKKVEDLVNDQIKKALPVVMREMDLKTAKTSGALGFFESKYGKIVKVYTIGPSTNSGQANQHDYFSKEICGGPHIKNTKVLGKFKIISEKSSSAEIRRIKAIIS